MPLKIVRNDITKMQVDAIVNTANSEPIYSTGVDTAVYETAGAEDLLAAKYIIHAVSPCYRGGENGKEELLRSCYRSSLALAQEKGCKSIAFPLISTGNLEYPKEEGLRIAVDEINAFLLRYDMLVYVVVLDAEATRLGQKRYPDLDEYIDRNYVAEKLDKECGHKGSGLFARIALNRAADRCESRRMPGSMPRNVPGSVTLGESKNDYRPEHIAESKYVDEAGADYVEECRTAADAIVPGEGQRGAGAFEEDGDYDEELWEEHESALNERMKHLSDTFQQYLLYLIAQKGLTNADVYNRAFVTKQLFSKIKLNKDYHPDKATAMRLCVGAKLSLDETKDLLARAGYALSPCDRRDVIFSYFIERGVYDMIDIDIALEEHGLPCFIA